MRGFMKISNIKYKNNKQQKQLLTTLNTISDVHSAFFDDTGCLNICCDEAKRYAIVAAIKAAGFEFDY